MVEKLSSRLVQKAHDRASRGPQTRSNTLNFQYEQEWKDKAYIWYNKWRHEKLVTLLAQLESEVRSYNVLAQEILINAWIAEIIEELLTIPEVEPEEVTW